MLALSLLVVPALTCQSVNADRGTSQRSVAPEVTEISYQHLEPLGGLGQTVRRLRLAPQDQDVIGLGVNSKC